MEQEGFREWVTRKSWNLSVRYCKVLALLMLPASLAIDVPLLRDGWEGLSAEVQWLLAWQVAVELTCLAVMASDRWLAARHRGAQLEVFCIIFMALTTWAGVRGALIGGSGLVFHAAGMTFLAALICTPRPVRRPLYMLSLIALMVPLWLRAPEPGSFVASLVAPFCVVALCMELDRVMLSRSQELYEERQRAERERARADKVLYNVLPASVADELKRDDRVNAQKFENMGVLFADIAGFTSFSRALPPDAIVMVLNQIFSAFDQLVERFHLEKIKTIGDAYMVVSHRHLDALGDLALEMVCAIQRYNRENGTELNMRIGMHVGPAVAGVIGVKRFLYDVWGDTVNVASRMEATGEPGAVHVSEAVYWQLRQRFVFEPRAPIEVKGRGTMSTWWLRARAPADVAPGKPDATGGHALPAAGMLQAG